MKWILGLAMVSILGVGCAFAQLDATATAAGAAPVRISDMEAQRIVETINGYMQSAMHRGRLNIFDRKKGQIVILRLDRIVTDDPARVIFPKEGEVVICGECTQVNTVVDEKGKKTEQDGDKYEVWFLVQRGGTTTCRVLETFVKSVNGQPMYKWTQDAAGAWSATLVPGEVQAESPEGQ